MTSIFNSYFLWDHNNSIYPKQDNTKNFQEIYKGSNFYLLNSTVILSDTNRDLELNNIKDYDKPHYKMENDNNINSDSYLISNSKNIFINDSFYNSFLDTEEKENNFINIHKNTNFNMLENIDKSNSSVYFYYQKISELKSKGIIKTMEEKINTQINGLTNYKKENIAIITNIYKFEYANNDFKYYRRVKVDGNSFYISFMYQYIKNLIIYNNETKLSNIFNIDKDMTIMNYQLNNNFIENPSLLGENYMNENKNDKDIDNIIQAFALLSLIYSKTVENDKDEALKILDYSFSYEEAFVTLLCIYMRLQIKKFININKDIFIYEKYCEKNNLINKNYFDIKNKSFLNEKYINENIIVNQMEPSLFIISLVPYIFNINLNLYINEQSSNKDINEQLCTKVILNQNNNPKINILYTSYSYHIIEMEENITSEINNNSDLANIFNITNNDTNNKEEYIRDINKDQKCTKCGSNKYIQLKNICKNETCLNCLKKNIKEIFIQRYNYMLKGNFKYIEYYLRDIPLIESNHKYLTSAEFYFLFQSNKFTYFRQLIKSICDICGKSEKKIINKKCKCKRCISCAKEEINNNIILNDFEKEYIFKKEFLKCKCKCGIEINQNDYASQIINLLSEQEKENLEKEAEKRIQKYIESNCMICGKNININEKGKNNSFNYNIDNDNDKGNEKNLEHLICKKCQNTLNSNNNSYYCVICRKNHIIKSKNKNKNIEENNDNKLNKDNKSINNINKSSSKVNKKIIKINSDINQANKTNNNKISGSVRGSKISSEITKEKDEQNSNDEIKNSQIKMANDKNIKKKKECCIRLVWNKIIKLFS